MSTTRIDRRGLESERRTGINLRIELEGAAEADVVRVSEAFCGRNSEDGEEACCASLRAFWRRRWGSSAVEAGGGGGTGSDTVVDFGGSLPLIEIASATVDVKGPLLPPPPMFPSNAFGEKYPAHNRAVVPATVARAFVALENFLLPNRVVGAAVFLTQDRHTILRPLDVKALAGGYRIIISRGCWVHKMSDHFSTQPAEVKFGLVSRASSCVRSATTPDHRIHQ